MNNNHLSDRGAGSIPDAAPSNAPSPAPPAWAHIKPEIRAAIEAFRRDLPELLARHASRCAAYSPTGRIALGESKWNLYQDCLRQGHEDGEFIVFLIEAEECHDVVFDVSDFASDV